MTCPQSSNTSRAANAARLPDFHVIGDVMTDSPSQVSARIWAMTSAAMFLVAAAISTSLLLPATAANDDDFPPIDVERWTRLIGAKKFDEAIAWLQPAANRGDESARAFLARTLYRAGRYGKAIPLFEDLIDRGYHVPPYHTRGWFWVMKAYCLQGLQQVEEARDAYGRAIAQADSGDHVRAAIKGLEKLQSYVESAPRVMSVDVFGGTPEDRAKALKIAALNKDDPALPYRLDQARRRLQASEEFRFVDVYYRYEDEHRAEVLIDIVGLQEAKPPPVSAPRSGTMPIAKELVLAARSWVQNHERHGGGLSFSRMSELRDYREHLAALASQHRGAVPGILRESGDPRGVASVAYVVGFLREPTGLSEITEALSDRFDDPDPLVRAASLRSAGLLEGRFGPEHGPLFDVSDVFPCFLQPQVLDRVTAAVLLGHLAKRAELRASIREATLFRARAMASSKLSIHRMSALGLLREIEGEERLTREQWRAWLEGNHPDAVAWWQWAEESGLGVNAGSIAGLLKLSREQMREDVDQLASLIRRAWVHAENKQEVFGVDPERIRTRVLERIPPRMATEDFVLLLAEFVAAHQDGHLALSTEGPMDPRPMNRPWTAGISLREVQEGFVIDRLSPRAIDKMDLAVGDLIEEVNGRPVGRLVEEASALVSASTENQRRRSTVRSWLWWPSDESTFLAIRRGRDEIHRVALAPMEQEPKSREQASKTPLIESKLLEDSIGYIRIRTFYPQAGALDQMSVTREGYESAIAPHLKELRDAFEAVRRARALILDVRGNGGGYERLAHEVARHLVESPFVFCHRQTRYSPESARLLGSKKTEGWGERQAVKVESEEEVFVFQGRLLVLVDEGCYSSTDALLACLADQRDEVTFIGRATGGGVGRPIHAGTLKHSGVIVRLPVQTLWSPKGRPIESHGTQPNVQVRWTRAHVLEGRDPDLEKALEIAR